MTNDVFLKLFYNFAADLHSQVFFCYYWDVLTTFTAKFEKMERTGEVIGRTMQPFDFMDTEDNTGGFFFSKASNKVIDMNRLSVTGTISPKGIRSTVYGASASEIVNWGLVLFSLVQKYSSVGTVIGSLFLLAELSEKGAPFDIKTSLGLDAYTPVRVRNVNGLPMITTLRAVGNMMFGANLRSLKPMAFSESLFYSSIMPLVGHYNQKSNGGNGYNSFYPYYGEHEYSGSYIKHGYFGHF